MKFEEPEALSGVSQFHQTFDLPVLSEPQVPDIERCALRINLIEEELDELKEAIAANDIVAAADAFADLQYVLSGAILEFGLGKQFKALFDEVQRSNMSKVCADLTEAEATLDHYRSRGVEGKIIKKDGHYLVYRLADGKVLKSVNYSEAQLAQIVEPQIVS